MAMTGHHRRKEEKTIIVRLRLDIDGERMYFSGVNKGNRRI